MCGIAGSLTRPVVDAEEILSPVRAMSSAIHHRGPDDEGFWSDATNGIALGHRRLSIVDLSAAGHQPMISSSGRYIIAFNGEIYNHYSLRSDLNQKTSGLSWRGHSDTETLLSSFELLGIDKTLSQAVGMFAFALWDKHERALYLVRDRFGEKPLYYGWIGDKFAFASEICAFRAFPKFENKICRNALSAYFQALNVPAPYSIYEGIYKLEPGCLLKIKSQAPSRHPEAPLQPGECYGSIELKRWWSLSDTVISGSHSIIDCDAEAIELLDSRLSEAVSLQSQADVPLGAFLSGGVDSSLIASLMQKNARSMGTGPIKTFTVGFDEIVFDESAHALAVAKHLGTEHYSLRVTSRDAMSVIDDLPSMYGEPFADSSQIPTHLVSKAAREHVTVALSGDAGDELFGGYNRHIWGPRLWGRMRRLPFHARQALASSLQLVPPTTWDKWLGHSRFNQPGYKLHKLGRAIKGIRSIEDLYRNLLGERHEVVYQPSNRKFPVSPWDASIYLPELPLFPEETQTNWQARMMYWDTLTYLPNDILCKVDRAAMAVSLETRLPFLDHRVAELAWRLPMSMKIRGSQGKWILRSILDRYIPRELIERPKAGFALPIGQWLCGPLRGWAEQLIFEGDTTKYGYLDSRFIKNSWSQHLSGRRDRSNFLWSFLIFQSWLNKNH